MKKLVLSFLLSLFVAAPAALAQPAKVAERVQASYLIAFGRRATDAEVAYWAKQNPASVESLVANHRNYLKQDANTQRAAIKRSYIDALGRNPNDGEFKHWMSGNDTYTQLMKNHVDWLARNPGEYESAIKRSYQTVLRRQPNAAEIKYWKSQGTLSYLMLVACHEDWAKRNGTAPKTSGGLSISGTPSITTAALSADIAKEARAASGVVAAGGGNVVAAGSANVVAAGSANVVAAGSANMVAAGGLN